MTFIGHRPSTVYAAAEGQKFKGDVDLICVTCVTCGVLYAIPERFDRSAREYPGNQANGWSICCPFGHQWHYLSGQTEADKLRRQLESERDHAAVLRSRLDQTESSLSATKGVVTKLKKRASNGVCPCCNRSFPKLHEHMKTKHPDYDQPSPQEQIPADQPRPARKGHRANVEAVLAFVGDGEKTYTEIGAGVGITSGHTSVLLHRMVANGEIQRVARGRYRRPRG